MRFCPVCRHCYENHDTICEEHGAPLKAWPQHKSPYDNWVSGSCQLTERYRLVRLISAGGMGTVFEGIDNNLNARPVAVKILHQHVHLTHPDALDRFRREALSASRISHQNVAVIHDYGVAAEWGTFIIMELIRGENVARHLWRVGSLPVHVACQIAQQISHGIAALHESGFVHRDLKPSNIIITHYDEGLVLIKVVDFGIVKAIEPIVGDEPTATDPGLYVGTPHYMSPEHCAGKRLDARSDIYSLGVLLFEMLTGEKPFNCKQGEEVVLLSKHLTERPPLLREYKSDLPEALELLIDRSLSKEPRQRPQSASDFARALRPFTQSNPDSLPNVQSSEPMMDSLGKSLAADPETETVLRKTIQPSYTVNPEAHKQTSAGEVSLAADSVAVAMTAADSPAVESLKSPTTPIDVGNVLLRTDDHVKTQASTALPLVINDHNRIDSKTVFIKDAANNGGNPGRSQRQKRTLWMLLFVLPVGIVIIGGWINVSDLRRMTGVDAIKQSSPVAKASSPTNPQGSSRHKPSPTRPKLNAINVDRDTTGKSTSSPERTAKSDVRESEAEPLLVGSTFTINSMGDSKFGIGAKFDGVLRINSESIEVEIPSPSLRLHSRAFHSGPRELQSVRAGVGIFNHNEPWKSRLNSSSQLVPLGRTVSPGENIDLKPLKFTIPKKGLADLSSLQLIFVIDNRAVVTGAEGNKTRVYAYSEL